jgi:hypothetical protein
MNRVLLLLIMLDASLAVAGSRAALVVSANAGDASEARLRYAELDAQQFRKVLEELGGFSAEHTVELTSATSESLSQALRALAVVARDQPFDLLTVYYSGHADALSLHLSGTRLALGELKKRLYDFPAKTKVLVLDACRSGGATNVKGGTVVPTFDVAAIAPVDLEGVAVITSSARGEDSLESDELKASFFTHAFVSGLMGAADTDNDGDVTLGEAFEFAARRTAAVTRTISGGAQHPTFELALRGRQSLVLTRPFATAGARGVLSLPWAGHFVIRRRSEAGAVVAEVAADGARKLRLDADTYFVTEYRSDSIRQGPVTIEVGKERSLSAETMQRVEYGQAVRKGGSARTSAMSLIALVNGRPSAFAEIGGGMSAGLTFRLDLPSLSLEARGLWTPYSRNNSRVGKFELFTFYDEFCLALAGLKTFDLSWASFSIGLEVGAQVWLVTYKPPQRDFLGPVLGAVVGPVVQLDTKPWHHLFLRAELSLPTTIVRFTDRTYTTTAGLESVLSLRAALGIGGAW